MRIYRMTATFGKLEHETLELQPGLNVVEAPNEWGKSTWCAFLMAMLYGLDTRAKSTKTALADKERYAPWSGSPMSGRIELNWRGRDITIERTTRGRTPMGVFRAYETKTGVELPELTGANCGQLLLGVEQSVFRRAGFIRQSDMPVTKDDALRRRLNDLVTTGDETGDGQRLEKQLRELKNRCLYNRTGLIPQAEAQLEQLRQQAEELEALQTQSKKLKERLSEEKQWHRELENHRIALEYAAAEADAARVAEIRDAKDRAEARLRKAENACTGLPAPEAVHFMLKQAQDCQRLQAAVQTQWQDCPDQPEAPVLPEPFRNRTPEQMKEMVTEDICSHGQLRRKPWLLLLLGVACTMLSVPALFARQYLIMGVMLGAAALLLIPGFCILRKRNVQLAALERKYASPDPAVWQESMQKCLQQLEHFQSAGEQCRENRMALARRQQELERMRRQICGEQTIVETLETCRNHLRCWEELEHARRELDRMETYLSTVSAMVRPAAPPAFEDRLTCSREDTEEMIAQSQEQQKRLLDRLGHCRGRTEAIGDPDALLEALRQAERRAESLKEVYDALTLAQETILEAQRELQRRFAPRISRRAQELLAEMTSGRYTRLTLNEDLSLLAGACQEDVLHESLWRSDGTVDQLYFALRLAVAEELTPGAPLVLDDAFVRFDDQRLRAALGLLRREAQDKQVILFTCQSREKKILR